MTARRWTTLGTALVMVVGLSACGSSTSAGSGQSSSGSGDASTSKEAGPMKIAYAGVNDSVPLYKALGDGLSTLAKKQGDTLTRFDNKQDPAAALSNARLMIQQKPDVAIDWSGAGNNDALGAQFTRAKVPCIAVNFPIEGCDLFNLDQAGTGSQLGKKVATDVKDKGWAPEEMFVMLVGAVEAGPGPIENVGGFYQGFAEEFPELDQMKAEDFTATTTAIGDSGLLVDGVGTVDGAYAATQRALQTIDPDKKLVVDVLADSMAPGVLRALEQAGRTDDVVLGSTGAETDALEQLRTNPIWVAEGDLGLPEWPRYLLAMSRARLDGAKMPEVTGTPYQAVTKADVDEKFDGAKAKGNLPVPEEDEYLLDHGLEG